MGSSSSTDYEIGTLTGIQELQAFKLSLLEYFVRFHFVRSALVDLHEPDWNGRLLDWNILSLSRTIKEQENAHGEEASAVSAASTSACDSSAPPANNGGVKGSSSLNGKLTPRNMSCESLSLMLKTGAESPRFVPKRTFPTLSFKRKDCCTTKCMIKEIGQNYMAILCTGWIMTNVTDYLWNHQLFKNKVQETYYEDHKAELIHWTIAQQRLNTRSAGLKISSKPDDSSFTVLNTSETNVSSSYCQKTGHSREESIKRYADEVDGGSYINITNKVQETNKVQAPRRS